MSFLSPNEKETLALLCETLIPSLEAQDSQNAVLFAAAASDFDVAERVETTLHRTTDKSSQMQFRLLMRGFEIAFLNGLLTGIWRPFSAMSAEERETVLYSWASSRFFARRKAFQAIKRTALFLHYAHLPEEQRNPTWPALQYPDPPGPAQETPRTIRPFILDHEDTLETDVLIIGSGAGGGVVAGELSAAGWDVLIVEKGGYRAEADFSGREIGSSEALFEKYGALATADTSMIVLAGSTLGGGTTVNWSASFRTPDHVLEEWARDYGFDAAVSAEYQRGLDAVLARSSVGTGESIANANNTALEKGSRALGYEVGVIPRNVKGCEDCGFCGYGCSFGAKQGTLKTYLQDAHERGARIMVNSYVEKVLHRSGRVSGAQILVTQPDGSQRSIRVKAKVVVAAAGAVQTPPLLLRSGLKNPNIGANLRLHPVTVTFGVFQEPVYMWRGAPMTRVCKEFWNLDGRGYGVYLETAPAHPGLSAATLSWTNARAHKELVEKMPYMANVVVLTRDFYGGRVRVDSAGQPILDYRVHPYDARHMQRGMLEALRIHHAAGALEVCAPHNEQLQFLTTVGGNFEHYLRQVASRGFPPNGYALFSAHQMASCRIAGSAALGALKPTSETYEVQGLFVADASAMPTASGVNPMMTIMGLAHYIAQCIKAQRS